jgi:hypothetical protein
MHEKTPLRSTRFHTLVKFHGLLGLGLRFDIGLRGAGRAGAQ